ncbi:UDP-N-acetylmuramate--L-alanine ligase [Synergistaceae bacterium OttesenSCG-928-I11]|nr:UDP-N-acetylmuramate--L-alanine ligase [Synergistaceae bacterium OttesenSCG-928-I11]
MLRADNAFIDIKAPKNIHLMGIGGAGMSGLALLLDSMGHLVSGCDMENTFYLNRIRQQGIQVAMGHHREHLDAFIPDLIIHTSAIAQDHPELIEARRRGIVVARRAEILSIIFNGREGVGVAGTHGKTTTSSMISLIAERAGLQPTVAIGGELSDIGCNAKLGVGNCMVAELDESDGSFELFSPSVTIVTNIDWDHIDHYPSFDDVVSAFGRFARGRKKETPLIACAEDLGVQKLLSTGKIRNVVTYGWGSGWTWGATDIRYQGGGGVIYTAGKNGRILGEVVLRVSGEHNVLNSLAALAASDCIGIPFESAASALAMFKGAKRRFQYVGETNDVIVYDDYGHHPREIAATMAAIAHAFPKRPVHVVFQPHRYTRTEALFQDFARALSDSHRVYLLPIYSADETPIPGVSSFLIADELIGMNKTDSLVCSDFQEASNLVCDSVKPGDLVLTIGAGNIEYLSKQILGSLQKRFPVAGAAAVVA